MKNENEKKSRLSHTRESEKRDDDTNCGFTAVPMRNDIYNEF